MGEEIYSLTPKIRFHTWFLKCNTKYLHLIQHFPISRSQRTLQWRSGSLSPLHRWQNKQRSEVTCRRAPSRPVRGIEPKSPEPQSYALATKPQILNPFQNSLANRTALCMKLERNNLGVRRPGQVTVSVSQFPSPYDEHNTCLICACYYSICGCKHSNCVQIRHATIYLKAINLAWKV